MSLFKILKLKLRILNMSEERKTDSAVQYLFLNNKNMVKECPGSQYDRTRNISVMILEESDSKDEFYLRDITYLDLDTAYKKYIVENCNKYPYPFDNFNVVHLDLLKKELFSNTNTVQLITMILRIKILMNIF